MPRSESVGIAQLIYAPITFILRSWLHSLGIHDIESRNGSEDLILIL